MSATDVPAEVVVDARGLRCPVPVIRAAAAARDAAPGTVLTVLWTDPAAEHDLPAWARMRGHTVTGCVVHDGPGPAVTATGPRDPAGTFPAGATTSPAWATTVRLGGQASPRPRRA